MEKTTSRTVIELEESFLGKVSNVVNGYILEIYYEDDLIGYVPFENNTGILEDKEFCTAIMEDFALNSDYFKQWIKNNEHNTRI